MFVWVGKPLFSQAGAHIFGGVTSVITPDKNLTLPKSGSIGYEAGIDARLNSDFMYFLFGGRFAMLTKEKMSIIKARVGLGFDVINFTERTAIRTKLQGSLNFINGYDDTIPTATGYEKVNDGFAGLATGVGLTLGSLMIDLDFEYGLFNVAFEQPTSKIHFLGLNAGFRF
jgi:hypothetical protein